MSGRNGIAVPLHIQRLERALDLTGLIDQIRKSSDNLGSVTEWERLPDGLSASLAELAEPSDVETADSEPDLPPLPDYGGSWQDGAELSRARRLLAADLLGSSEDEWPDEAAELERPLSQLDLARMLQQHRMKNKLSRQYQLNPVVGGAAPSGDGRAGWCRIAACLAACGWSSAGLV
ncbi:uncharacterized protein LOC119108709 [Pollicipes pollicipes]|uniref:uncharacterized protein LOC119108709 n=1 Tax=Pollicipes pollicipes TaxID=41117 RepID=UPI00188491BA|nr:uncharacterized protein LOC119108709 [Pollicipes pollicipes]